jgi:hypothetical protein
MDHSGYRSYKNAQQERRNTVMGTSSNNVSDVFKVWSTYDSDYAIRYPDGSVAGYIVVHEDRQEDGSICAQLELRFEDQSSLVTIAEVGLADERHEAGRSWVLVEMEPRESYTEPLRFRINIPGKPRPTGQDTGNIEAAIATVDAARKATRTVREGCRNSYGCAYPVCRLVEDGCLRKLADDGRLSKLESLEAQSLHSPDSGT